ncbi:thioesterase family protein [Roseixanthobacter glucoisosaccharinicivorans]|uniref:thioesterase family protein n=1 Tax=Roseixanthobacter glucoisosaccharinicivorans TaxID=3119923 RepID=UPI00372A34E4
MWDRIDFEPVFFAPFVSSAMKIEPEWIDGEGHLSMAYYNVLFDRAFAESLALLGLGPQYVRTRGVSFFTAEAHMLYLRPLPAVGDVRVTMRLLDYDAKRLHLFLSLHHGTEGWVAATCEQVTLQIDGVSQRAAPFADDVLERVAGMRSVHAALPQPDGIGRSIGLDARC